MKELLEILVMFIVILAVCTGLAVGIYALVAPPSCDAATQSIGYPHKWELSSGCMIEVEPGRWIPLENFRYFDE